MDGEAGFHSKNTAGKKHHRGARRGCVVFIVLYMNLRGATFLGPWNSVLQFGNARLWKTSPTLLLPRSQTSTDNRSEVCEARGARSVPPNLEIMRRILLNKPPAFCWSPPASGAGTKFSEVGTGCWFDSKAIGTGTTSSRVGTGCWFESEATGTGTKTSEAGAGFWKTSFVSSPPACSEDEFAMACWERTSVDCWPAAATPAVEGPVRSGVASSPTSGSDLRFEPACNFEFTRGA